MRVGLQDDELTGEKKGPAVVATVVRQQEGEPL